MSRHATIRARKGDGSGTYRRGARARSRRCRFLPGTEPVMPLPIRHLPVLQNWDCHVCGNCCKEYPVTITDEEKKRIEGQGWEKDLSFQHLSLFKKIGPFFRSRYQLNRRPDGSCVFLGDDS